MAIFAAIRKFVIRQSVRVPTRARLPLVLGLAIIISLIMTGISVAIYTMGGFSKLDLSRPGFERERQEVRQADSTKTYDTTSPVTVEALDEFLKEYDSRVKDLNGYGDFRDQSMEDSALQLTATSPSLR